MAPQTPAPQPSQSKSSFAAVADASTRVLILGSLPGEASLRRAQYYAHPQNQFWRLAGAVINADLAAAAYPDRLQILLRAGIGLWDVISSAERRGSLDADIRNHQPNALAAFAATLPSLRAIGFNGRKAAAIGRKLLGSDAGVALIDLPSSSPAYTLSFAAKAAAWARLERFLNSATE